MTAISDFNGRIGDTLREILTQAALQVDEMEQHMSRLQAENISLRGGASHHASTRQLALSRQYPQPIHSDQTVSPSCDDANNILDWSIARPSKLSKIENGIAVTLEAVNDDEPAYESIHRKSLSQNSVHSFESGPPIGDGDGDVHKDQSYKMSQLSLRASSIPPGLELYDEWQKLADYTVDHDSVMHLTKSLRSSAQSESLVSDLQDNTVPKFRISPTGRMAMFWDLLFVVVLVHDFIFFPIKMCVDKESGPFEICVSWFTRIFWTASVPVTMVTGYIHTSDGRIEYSLYMIGKRYMRSWAIFDVSMVISDWMQVLLQGAGFLESMLLMKGLRMLRVVRVIKLVKVLKVPDILARIKTRSHFERIELCANILMAFLCLFGVLHVIACFWFCVGDADAGWVHKYSYEERNWDAQYAVSLHWVLSQVFGNSEVFPTSNHERWFTVWVSSLCFFVSTCFASEVTASLTRLSFISSQRGKQFATLRQYLQYNAISSHVCLRVFKCATFMVNKLEEDLPESDVELLKIISKGLLAEIHYDVNVPILAKHPLFKRYNSICPIVVKQVCHSCISRINLSLGDFLFVAGEGSADPVMYFITQGDSTYSKGDMQPHKLVDTQWLCEMALWVHWRHRGTIRAESYASFVSLNATKFQKIFREFREISFFVVTYVTNLLTDLNESDAWLDLDDIDYGGLDINRLVTKTFPNQMRRASTGINVRPSLITSSIASGASWWDFSASIK